MAYIKVLINISHNNISNTFTYKCINFPSFVNKDDLIGHRVIVPFGRGNKNVEGFILDIDNNIDESIEYKEVISFIDKDKLFSKNEILLAKWMSKKYFSRLIDCLNLFKPQGTNFKSNFVYEYIPNQFLPKLTGKEKEILNYIKASNIITENQLKENFSNYKQYINKLKEKKLISINQINKIQDMTIKIKILTLDKNFKKEIEEIKAKKNKQSLVIYFLEKNPNSPYSVVKDMLDISNSPIDTLIKNGIITVTEEVKRRDATNLFSTNDTNIKELTKDQQNVLNIILQEKEKTNKKPILIHGVTGSGKTEVYLRIIEKVLKEEKSAIVLVPEISLTPQLTSIFKNRFPNLVGFCHSKLSKGERFDLYQKAKNGEISIVIGPRSAIFTPFNNLGIIIIDESHENTYKSEQTPKYDTIKLSEKIAQVNSALLVLGSATPSINSYYNCQTNKYILAKMEKRVNNSFPKCSIIDMRIELAKGNMSILSSDLQQAMKEALEKKQQVILFLNKRGFSNFVSCRACGNVIKCDNCSVNYTYHKFNESLICHYCNAQIKTPSNCPICGSKYIRPFGLGTQKIEEEIKKLFPMENILRMDADTTSGKHGHEILLNKFKNKEASILIGTQMIAKGLDFPLVTVVGVIAADLSLNNGDYRSSETTFSLLTQVCGRAGRGELTGQAFIQTYNPDHYSIRHAKNYDYESFYQDEITHRKSLLYPPYTNIFTIMFIGNNEKNIIIKLNKLVSIMKEKTHEYDILGPAPCVISKINNKFRWRVIIKGDTHDGLVEFSLESIKQLNKEESLSDIELNLNINPVSIM